MISILMFPPTSKFSLFFFSMLNTDSLGIEVDGMMQNFLTNEYNIERFFEFSRHYIVKLSTDLVLVLIK